MSAFVKLNLIIVALFLLQQSLLAQQKQQVEEVVDIIKHRKAYPDYILVAAHRGYWADFPENSIQAYQMAIEIGADIIEIDVRLTEDDEMVVFHDVCLDRMTTGYGRLREEKWDYVSSLHLRNDDGTISKSKVLSLSSALDYLKDKAVVAVDIKEGGSLFFSTMIRVLKMLKSKKMLWQSIVKGRVRLEDLQQIVLDKTGISLKDFLYTPVAHATTKNLDAYITEYLTCPDIYAMELAYKQSADILLPYVERLTERGIWSGLYSFWPETSEGVIAEKRPLTDTDPIIRRYDFKDRDPNNPLDDGRGDWDWVFRHGADYVITDRSELLIDYLTKCGKRQK